MYITYSIYLFIYYSSIHLFFYLHTYLYISFLVFILTIMYHYRLRSTPLGNIYFCLSTFSAHTHASNFHDNFTYLCFNRIPKGQDIQMVQYASFHRATEALRSLKGREHSPHPSTATTTTQVDTLTRSRTASPSSTLPRNSTLG